MCRAYVPRFCAALWLHCAAVQDQARLTAPRSAPRSAPRLAQGLPSRASHRSAPRLCAAAVAQGAPRAMEGGASALGFWQKVPFIPAHYPRRARSEGCYLAGCSTPPEGPHCGAPQPRPKTRRRPQLEAAFPTLGTFPNPTVKPPTSTLATQQLQLGRHSQPRSSWPDTPNLNRPAGRGGLCRAGRWVAKAREKLYTDLYFQAAQLAKAAALSLQCPGQTSTFKLPSLPKLRYRRKLQRMTACCSSLTSTAVSSGKRKPGKEAQSAQARKGGSVG
jgi:hypothetical protein